LDAAAFECFSKSSRSSEEGSLANDTLSEAEWLELYRYLLMRLEERRFNDVRAEIEAAAAAPLIEESSPEDQARVSKLVRGEVGKAVIRRREPKEVFNAAVDVLSVRLIELPALASRVAELFKVQAANIEFRVDYEEGYALVESKPVRLDGLLAPEADTNAMRESLRGLGAREERTKA
jgi:hypothetical protein